MDISMEWFLEIIGDFKFIDGDAEGATEEYDYTDTTRGGQSHKVRGSN